MREAAFCIQGAIEVITEGVVLVCGQVTKTPDR